VLSPGALVSGGRVRRSVLSPAVCVDAGAEVVGSVLLNGVHVGAGAVVHNAILDKHVVVPPGARIGVDPEEDRARGLVVQDGLTVLGKDEAFPA
jgi:glucose-1-phosphate adenylyltransferase